MSNGQGGELVAVLRGANAPLLQRMIVEELAKEKLVLEQGGERRAVSVKCTHTFTHSCAPVELKQHIFLLYIHFDLSPVWKS